MMDLDPQHHAQASVGGSLVDHRLKSLVSQGSVADMGLHRSCVLASGNRRTSVEGRS